MKAIGKLTEVVKVYVIDRRDEQALGRLEWVILWHVHLQLVLATLVRCASRASHRHMEEANVIIVSNHIDSLHYKR